MAKRPRPWTVGAHEPPRQVEDGLWTVEDLIPGTPFRRVMVIARRSDGDLIFYNAIPLSEATLAAVASWGRPRWLAIANVFHMIDAHAFRERLGVRLLCAASAIEKARTRATVDGTFEALPPDEHVRTVSLPGVRQGETALVFSKDGRASAAFGDAFMNVPKGSGVINALLGVSGGPKCPPTFRWGFVRDKQAVAAALRGIADTPGLVRLIPSHGDVLEKDAAEVLRAVIARDLG